MEISGDVELTATGPGASGNITTPGDIFANSVVQTSAARFKEDIAPLDDALAKVEQLRGVSFAWKDSGRRDIGVVAEEVEQVLPELVRHEDSGEARGVDYAKLTAVLIEAVKVQQAQIRELQRRIDAGGEAR